MRLNNYGRVGKYFALLVVAGILGACSNSSPAVVQPPMEQVMITTTKSPAIVSTYTPTVRPMPSVTASLTASPTSQLYKVSIQAFHDFNGNGTKDPDEPDLEGIVNVTGDQKCTTDVNGSCSIMLPEGKYPIRVVDNRDVKSYEKMRYILPSVSEDRKINRGLEVDVKNNIELNVPLAQGSCLLPFPLGWNYEIGTYFDTNPQKGEVGNWKGESDTAVKRGGGSELYSYKIRVEDGHYGIDYVFNQKTPIVSSDSGIISSIRLDKRQKYSQDHIINITTDDRLVIDLGHINPIDTLKEGQRVSRGELIGYSVQHDYYPFFKKPVYMVHIGFFLATDNKALDPYTKLWTIIGSDMSRTNLNQ